MSAKGLQPDRLSRIKKLIDLLKEGPMTQAELGGLSGYSTSGVRKNMKIMLDSNIVIVERPGSQQPAIYSITAEEPVMEKFVSNIDAIIASGAGKALGDKEAQSNIVVGIRFTHHHIGPGRTIYRALDTND